MARFLTKIIKSRDLNEYMYLRVPSGTVHNNQQVETTPVQWMDRQTLMCPYSRIFCSHRKE